MTGRAMGGAATHPRIQGKSLSHWLYELVPHPAGIMALLFYHP